MIKEVIMYGCSCDNCGKEWTNYDGMVAYSEFDHMKLVAQESGWELSNDKKTYCPECSDSKFDDDTNIYKNQL